MNSIAPPAAAPALEAFQRDFEALDAEGAPAWLVARRTAAMRRFLERGLPSRRDEAWLYTDLRDVRDTARTRAGAPRVPVSLPDIAAALSQGAPGPQIVVVNGRIDEGASTLAAPWLCTWADALAEHGETLDALLERAPDASLVDLNTAFLEEAAVVRIPQGTAVEHPLHIVHVAAPDGADTPTVTHPRLFVFAEEGCEAQIVETYVRVEGGPDLVNAVTEVHVGRSAQVRHLRIQMEGDNTQHIGTTTARLGRDAVYDAASMTFGGRLARHAIRIHTTETGGEAHLNGLYVLSGEAHADTHIVIDHEKPHGASHQLYRGVLGDKARGAFTGRVVVHEDAQKVNATQANHNLLLSRDALAETRPQLEIYADDVQCAHGATVGELDDEAIFYLQSRAIAKDEAKRLLIRAFAHEVVKKIRNEDLQRVVHDAVEQRLDAGTLA